MKFLSTSLTTILLLSVSINAVADKSACLPTGHITTDGRDKQTLAGTLLEKGVKAQPSDTVYYLFAPRTLSGSWQGGNTGTFAGIGSGKLTLIDTDSNGWETYLNERSNIKVLVNRDRTVVQHTKTDRSLIHTTMYRCIKK
ncbi:MAG: hypothetical protein OQL19_13675 [Gammaproteobacteria bacterium]|nr:hypothetical protein [Gammaproteobacteria bacterium]